MGLKAVTLYSQMHHPHGCLRITTVACGRNIRYVRLHIDPDTQDVVMDEIVEYHLDKNHQQWAGTELRLVFPLPDSKNALENALDKVMLYFQCLCYNAPSECAIEFHAALNGQLAEVAYDADDDPINRFADDLGVHVEDVVFAESVLNNSTVNAMAVMTFVGDDSTVTDISVLRYANHSPLLAQSDIHTCAIMKAIGCQQFWRMLGLQCS